MRLLIVILLAMLINSCWYSNGCIYTPQMVHCYNYNYFDYPDITKYQKPDSLGNTNKEQRWQDAISCGAKYTEDGWVHKTVPRLDDFDEENVNGIRKFALCMKDKGYYFANPTECWKKNICHL
ncbi:hypothetical protein EV694_0507 [Volucribacter psittacicida]|uniref:Uncharacterized protein n=1 Tax=Volucribacter psittacicida TaxID=203482 RepID=A0A4R1G5M6_9PAST|nr:hypothetical protein [Volucribacter psittacicida]TCK01873.1 hypothetical protein EV694_0507 [Volucribacter psittacicida]